jgi:hypothetical protein
MIIDFLAGAGISPIDFFNLQRKRGSALMWRPASLPGIATRWDRNAGTPAATLRLPTICTEI